MELVRCGHREVSLIVKKRRVIKAMKVRGTRYSRRQKKALKE